MNPSKRQFILYLEDILMSIEKIQDYIHGLEYIEFKEKSIAQDAVIRNFEIIGEAAKNIPIEIANKYPNIPWKKMYAMRNIITHEYFGIDLEIIWEIIKNELPDNYDQIKIAITSEQ